MQGKGLFLINLTSAVYVFVCGFFRGAVFVGKDFSRTKYSIVLPNYFYK